MTLTILDSELPFLVKVLFFSLVKGKWNTVHSLHTLHSIYTPYVKLSQTNIVFISRRKNEDLEDEFNTIPLNGNGNIHTAGNAV